MEFFRSLFLAPENYATTMPLNTDMEVVECEKCKIWMPKEKAPTHRRKKRTIASSTCRPCRKHQNKCKLSKSSYY